MSSLHPSLHPNPSASPTHALCKPPTRHSVLLALWPSGAPYTVLRHRRPTGASADPKKVALFRAASRVHAGCVADYSCVERADNNTGVRFFSTRHHFAGLLAPPV